MPTDFLVLVKLALEEDSPAGDITSESIFDQKDQCRAILIAKESGLLCGLDVVHELNSQTSNQFTIQQFKKDTDKFVKGDKILELNGSLITILKIERILLNFLQYLSGIASETNRIVERYGGQLFILDTRKTMPGYRKLVKYAVYCGGGANHRLNLSDMAMLKDNHVAMAGSIEIAVKLIRDKHPSKKVELEIDNLFQLDEAIESNPDIILLDNFSIEDTTIAVQKIREKKPFIRIECSGGITPEKLSGLAKLNGVGVSMGYLTHTTRFIDLSLEIEKK